jgi:protein-tyrosine phosphatase
VIDIHSHLLPGVDDGPKTWEDAIALCRALTVDGITTAVATPHLIDGVYANLVPRVEALVGELGVRLEAAHVPLTVLPGAEVAMSCRHLTDEDFALVPRLAGRRYMLIELPATLLPRSLESLLFSVSARGVTPVIAHPERCVPVQENLDVARAWHQAGAILQLDAESVLGIFGPGAQRAATRLIAAGLANALASDSHSCRRRPPRLGEATRAVADFAGTDVAAFLSHDGPGRLVAGLAAGTAPRPPAAPPRRGLLARGLARLRRQPTSPMSISCTSSK